jgi:hypothetical protein
MGRFYAIVVVLVAACGDNEVPPASVDLGQHPVGTTGALQPQVRELPEVCGDLQWSSSGVATTAMKLSVSTSSDGFTVLGVPTAGGKIEGFVMSSATKATGTVASVPITDTFTSVGVTRVGGQLVTAASDGSSVQVVLLDDSLQNPVSIAQVPGTLVTAPAMLAADGSHIVPVAGTTGVSVETFDRAWQPVSSLQLASMATAPAGFAATQLGAATLVAWTTATECDLATIYTPVAGQIARADYPCASPRLTTDLVHGTSSLVFEAPDGVRLMHISHMQMGGASQLLRGEGATSPRVMFDGTHVWVTYIDLRGDLVAGILTGDGNQLVSTAIFGTRPTRDAYDIAMFDGAPWVFALDANGYTAHRMCVVQEQ